MLRLWCQILARSLGPRKQRNALRQFARPRTLRSVLDREGTQIGARDCGHFIMLEDP